MTTILPGALQQTTATFDPTGGFGAGRRLMPMFGLPTNGPTAPRSGPAQWTPPQPPPVASPAPRMQTPALSGPTNPPPAQQTPVGALTQVAPPRLAPAPSPGSTTAFGLPAAPAAPGIRALMAPVATSVAGPSDVDPTSGLRMVTSPINSWRNPALDPRQWTNNPNVLQQTDPNALIWALTHFGGPTTPEARALTQEWGMGSNDMGLAYARLLDQTNQDKWLYDSILENTLQGNDSPVNRAFHAQEGSPNGYTAEEWADLMYRTSKGFGAGLNPARNDAVQQVYELPDGSVGTRAQLDEMGLAPGDGNWDNWKRRV